MTQGVQYDPFGHPTGQTFDSWNAWDNTVSLQIPPPQKIEDRLRLLAWGKRYLPNHIAGEHARFHIEFQEALEQYDRLALAAPRGHAKSTVANLCTALYLAAEYREPFLLIVGDTEEQAKNHLGRIQKELIENEALIAAYPHLKLPEGGDYRRRRVLRKASEIITIGGIKFQAKGARQSLRGLIEGANRPTVIIADDLENDDGVATARQRRRLEKWFRESLSNLFGPRGGRLILIGTILHRDSLLATYTKAKTAPPAYWFRVYKALENGVPLWPSEWTLERLKAKRDDIKSEAFLKEYMNTPVDASRVLWREEWIERNRVPITEAIEFVRKIVTVDPNTEGGDGKDEAGILVQGSYRRADLRLGAVTIADYTTTAGPIAEIDPDGNERPGWGRIALDACFSHDCDAIVAEKNQGGKMIRATLQAALRPGEELPNIILVNARRGKLIRAEPVSVLEQEARVGMLGEFTELEDQLVSWMPGQPSPGRLDAYVHGLTHLIVKRSQAEDEDDLESTSGTAA